MDGDRNAARGDVDDEGNGGDMVGDIYMVEPGPVKALPRTPAKEMNRRAKCDSWKNL